MQKIIILLQSVSLITMIILLATTKFMWLALAIALTLISIILNVIVLSQKPANKKSRLN